MKVVARHEVTELVAVDVEPVEDGLVQQFPSVLAGTDVELVRPIEQVEGGDQHLMSSLEAAIRRDQFAANTRMLLTDVPQSGSDLLLREIGIAEEVQEAVLLFFELLQLDAKVVLLSALCSPRRRSVSNDDPEPSGPGLGQVQI